MSTTKKMTYSQALVLTVTKYGMLSRVALASGCKELGCDNGTKLKAAIAKAVKDKLLAVDNASYILGDVARGAAADGYERRLREARQARAQAQSAKEASRARAEKQYAKNLKAAGGLTETAKADRAWMEGAGGLSRPAGRIFAM